MRLTRSYLVLNPDTVPAIYNRLLRVPYLSVEQYEHISINLNVTNEVRMGA